MCDGLLRGSAEVLYTDYYFFRHFSVLLTASGALLLRKCDGAVLKISEVGRSCSRLVLLRCYGFSFTFAMFFTAAEDHCNPVYLIKHLWEQDGVIMGVFMVGWSCSWLMQIWGRNYFLTFSRNYI